MNIIISIFVIIVIFVYLYNGYLINQSRKSRLFCQEGIGIKRQYRNKKAYIYISYIPAHRSTYFRIMYSIHLQIMLFCYLWLCLQSGIHVNARHSISPNSWYSLHQREPTTAGLARGGYLTQCMFTSYYVGGLPCSAGYQVQKTCGIVWSIFSLARPLIWE